MIVQIPLIAIKAAIDRMDRTEATLAGWTDRRYAKHGGFDTYARRLIQTVGDVRRLMDDETDQLVAGFEPTQQVELI